ncbi:hypothetical protein SLE2022_135270 [Rubroshorea leprosula]
MAKYNICAIFAILFMASGVIMTLEGAVDPIKENNCEGKMDTNCVLEVFGSIFKNGTVTQHCCQELIALGQVCHYAYVNRALQLPEFKNENSSIILAKAKQSWDTCYSVSPTPSP